MYTLRAARRAQRRLADEVAHGVDAVVGGRVELVQVVGRAGLDGHARLAHAARLAVLQVRAVEGLGEDAGRRRLAGAPGAAEQVGVADPLLAAPRCAAPAPRGPGRAPRRTGAGGSGGRATGRPRTRSLPAPGQRRNRAPVRRSGDLRHTAGSAESCCLPALTRFTGSGCTGPGRLIEDGFGDTIACPLPVAVPAATASPGEVRERTNRHAWKACVRTPPWVRIPLSPPACRVTGPKATASGSLSVQ